MFERFTDRSRKVMALANQEAQRFNHEYIGTEHLLLGLVKEGSGLGANILKSLGVDLDKVRAEVEKLVKSGPQLVTVGKLPMTPRAKMVINYAIEEARNLNHNYIGTEHLLLGVLRERDGVAAHVLMNMDLELEQVRAEIIKQLGVGVEPLNPPAVQLPTPHAVAPPDSPRLASPVGTLFGFTDCARNAMILAGQEAQRCNFEYIGTEHILLGLVKEGTGIGGRVLINLDVDLDKARAEASRLVKSEPGSATPRDLPLTPRAKTVIDYSIEEARKLNHKRVGTVHLLLGLLRDRDGVAALVLTNLNLNLENVRAEVLDLAGRGVEEPSAAEPLAPPAPPIAPASRPDYTLPPKHLGEAWISLAIGVILLLALPNSIKYFLSFAHLAEAPIIVGADGAPIPYISSVFCGLDLGITLFAIALIADGVTNMLTRRRAWLKFVAAFLAVTVMLNAGALANAYLVVGFQIIPALAIAFGVYRLIELIGRIKVAAASSR